MSTTDTSPREIATTRLFSGPVALVYALWTDPAHIVKWYGPSGFTNTVQKMDVRPGGDWIHVLKGPDGREWPNHSVYTEVVPNRRLCYQHQTYPHHTVTVIFEDLGAATRVSMRMVFDTAELREKIAVEHKAVTGQQQTLDRLEALVKSMA
jgi:uncharacterized protein YndB with AHSA1/START domain